MTDANYPRRGQFRPITELPIADAPTVVEVENADGSMRQAPYGAGGGDPWDQYGFPDWRSDFKTPADFAPWTVLQGSLGNIGYRAGGGVYSTSGDIWLGRAVANVPFIFDVRYELSGQLNVTSYDVLVGYTGNLAPNRRAAHSFYVINEAGMRARTFDNLTPLSTGFGAGFLFVSVNTVNRGITVRLRYDGTTLRLISCWGGPRTAITPNASLAAIGKASMAGDPLGVFFSLPSVLGGQPIYRCRFAQYQTTNLDDYAGM